MLQNLADNFLLMKKLNNNSVSVKKTINLENPTIRQNTQEIITKFTNAIKSKNEMVVLDSTKFSRSLVQLLYEVGVLRTYSIISADERIAVYPKYICTPEDSIYFAKPLFSITYHLNYSMTLEDIKNLVILNSDSRYIFSTSRGYRTAQELIDSSSEGGILVCAVKLRG